MTYRIITYVNWLAPHAMAEVLGTTVGVISLGMHLCDAITQSISNSKTRDEQVGGILRRSRHLKQLPALLDPINGHVTTIDPEASGALSVHTSTCEVELRALRQLADDLIPPLSSPTDAKGKIKGLAE